MSPIGRDTDTVHAQIGEVKTFNGKLYEKQELVENSTNRRRTSCSRASCHRTIHATHRWRHCRNNMQDLVSTS